MVDFAKIMANRYAAMNDEERARHDAHVAREARFNETRASMVGHFERREFKKDVAPVITPGRMNLSGLTRRPVTPAPRTDRLETVITKEWDEEISVRIEDHVAHDGTEDEVIRFIGGPTGHEGYVLDDSFMHILMDPEERRLRPRWYICAGTPGRWDACWVDISALESYVREQRPSLFEAEAAPSPFGP